MTRLAALTLLAACAGGADDPDDPGTLTVRLSAEPFPEWLRAADAGVEQVVVRGPGPDGFASISADVAARWDLAGPPLDVPVGLTPGDWPDVELTITLGPVDGPGLRAEVAGGGGLSAVSLLLREDGEFVLPVDGATVEVTVVPGAWEHLREADEGTVGPADEDYDDIVDEIVDTARWAFPPGPDE